MPARSPESLARKLHNAKLRKREVRAAKRKQRIAVLPKVELVLPAHKISARRMMGPIGPKTKAELREMLAQAFANTARL